MQELAVKRAKQYRAKAAWCFEMANAHPLGSQHYTNYLREHGEWLRKAILTEGGSKDRTL